MLRPREEGGGGKDGVVLNLTMTGDGTSNAVYSVKALVGKSLQPLMLSVDTGSSDVWLASKSCSSAPCSDAHTSLYDPSSSAPTSERLDLPFLRGSVSGPIVWDDFRIGPYSIPSQALAAADQVTDELLSADFVGLLGLALPPNSKIAQLIPSTETDAPDGATLQMNLFGLTPAGAAPAQRFFSLSLGRPGSARIPSLLGIGRHPAGLVPGFDPAKVAYSELISSRAGDTFWRVPVASITAWVDGVPKPVRLDRSTALPTSAQPVALVDSGGPIILASADIANGIYGAWGIGPAADGNYYVPCTTPMNISVGLADLPPIALHPLDLTAPPRADAASRACVGQIQAAPAATLAGFADVVLGVPFLRNVYTVLAAGNASGAASPRLGLLGLTDAPTALAEFHTVRVLGRPLDAGAPPARAGAAAGGKRLGVGVTVLVCILGFFLACGALFGVRFWILRRRFRRGAGAAHVEAGKGAGGGARWAAAREGKPRGGAFYPESSAGSELTRVDAGGGGGGAKEDGARLSSRAASPASSAVSELGHTREDAAADGAWGPAPALHVRTPSDVDARAGAAAAATPLLDEFGAWADAGRAAEEAGIAGIGTRGSAAAAAAAGGGAWRRPRGPRDASGGSISSVASGMWHAEVGQVLEPVDGDDGGAARR